MKSYFKRFIVVCFTLIIIFVNISSFYYVAYADNQSSGGHFGSNTDLTPFNKLYDGFDFSDTIAKHESFYFSDSVGNKHAVARVGSAWICLFGSRATFNGTQDEQLNYYLSYYAYTGYKSITNSFGSLMASKLGSITKGGYTLVENALSSNISTVAKGISYNEADDSISIDSNSIDKLREEIKKYYYDSIGIRFIYPTDNHNPAYLIELNRSLYDYEEDYISDFNALSQYDYAVGTSYGDYTTRLISGFDKNSYSYCYLGSLGGNNYIYFLDKDMNVINDSVLKIFNAQSYGSGNERIDLEYSFKSVVPSGLKLLLRLFSKSGDTYKEVTFYNGFTTNRSCFYSKDNKPFIYFSSYEKLYNFLNGSQTAYLSSRIDKAGEDITFSIKDMNENLGSKMDTLIDSINDKKGSMTADELQNAIDKGIENLNKNTEDIKDNTSDILDVLREQNQILLDILGVTTNIYKVVKESDSKEKTYNINYVQSVFNSMFKGLKNAVLYGENTVRDDVSEDSDDIDSIVSDIPPDKKNYHNGLFGRFPFSVPYQLFDWLQALYVEPVAPKFALSYAYLFKDLGYETNNFEFVIDLGDEKYSKWIELVRSGEKLSFIIYMAIATYHRFKNEI
jgi:hypothetical protein